MPLGVRCVPHGRGGRGCVGLLVWKRSLAWPSFGVAGCGAGMLLGSRTATPDVRRPVRFVSRDGPRMPVGVRSVAWRVRGGLRTG